LYIYAVGGICYSACLPWVGSVIIIAIFSVYVDELNNGYKKKPILEFKMDLSKFNLKTYG